MSISEQLSNRLQALRSARGLRHERRRSVPRRIYLEAGTESRARDHL